MAAVHHYTPSEVACGSDRLYLGHIQDKHLSWHQMGRRASF